MNNEIITKFQRLNVSFKLHIYLNLKFKKKVFAYEANFNMYLAILKGTFFKIPIYIFYKTNDLPKFTDMIYII